MLPFMVYFSFRFLRATTLARVIVIILSTIIWRTSYVYKLLLSKYEMKVMMGSVVQIQFDKL